ncbi:hypothetical protein Lal_00043268 [Lupinus albus]|nr:hypothetical protein Lal_00043268 [Lupinus albus]
MSMLHIYVNPSLCGGLQSAATVHKVFRLVPAVGILVRRPVFPIFGHQRVFLRFDCIKRSGDFKPVMQPVFGRKLGRDNTHYHI